MKSKIALLLLKQYSGEDWPQKLLVMITWTFSRISGLKQILFKTEFGYIKDDKNEYFFEIHMWLNVSTKYAFATQIKED